MSFPADVLSYPVMEPVKQPPKASHYLPARYYALLGGRLAEWGIDVPSAVSEAGIRLEVLLAPDGQLTPDQVESLIRVVVARAGRTDLGFELGRLLKLSSHDILGYGMLSAPTLDHALRLVARYFSLITPTYVMKYRSEAKQVEASFLPALPLSPLVLNLHLEAIAVGAYETVRTLLSGNLPSCSIYLSMDRPPHAERYRELSAAVMHFGQEGLPGARMLIDREVALRPLALSDNNAVQMAEARCDALLGTITNRSSLSDWLHMMLREARDGQPTLEELANILNLSARTLERRLAQEGRNFRNIASRARHESACELMRAGRLSVTQIAYQLGYRDVANFSRAFRREAGMAPSEYKLSLGAENTELKK